MSQEDQSRQASGFVLGSVLFATALCTLLLQVLLTRVLSVVMWYHFTFAVISIGLLGIAAGSMWFYRQHGSRKDDLAKVDFWDLAGLSLNGFALATALPIGLMLVLIGTPTMSMSGLVLLSLYFLACGAPFFASGYLTAAIFRFGSKRISSLYAADLVGASLGCLLALPALNYLGGIGSLLLVALLASVIATVLSARVDSFPRKAIAGLTTLVFGVGFLFHVAQGTDLRTVKLSLREEEHETLQVKWNSHSRLAVLDYYDPDKKSRYPFLSWGLSSRYEGWLPRQYLITIDGASETPITEMKGEDVSKHEYLGWDVTSLPYHLRPKPKALVIGAGGGRDVLTAYYFGSEDVTGVEINRGIVEWIRGDYAEFSGNLYTKPEIHIHIDDGRNFVRSSKEKYDTIQISMIDTFAATSAGAYTLSENNLYTAEAFDSYLNHLNDAGILSINRFFLRPPQQTLRIVTMAREALERRGVTDAQAHILVAAQPSGLGDNGLVMIAMRPFTKDELATADEVCETRGFERVAWPGKEIDNRFSDYLRAEDPETFYASYDFDVRPPQDDWPFFFNTCKPETLLGALQLRLTMNEGRVYNFDAVFILFVLLGLSVVALAAFVFLPLLLARRGAEEESFPGRKLTYFVMIGLGFILVEIVLVQRFNLYLGHPVYSLAVILVSVLLFSGIGSFWTSRWSDAGLGRSLLVACGAVVVLAFIHHLTWRPFLDATLGLPLATRIGLTVLSLAPFGIAMGMPYPLGMRAVSGTHPEGLPWVWAV
ncbi:MAG: hypothetical protein N2C14_23185, partial [Planctomycetales bacterium]